MGWFLLCLPALKRDQRTERHCLAVGAHLCPLTLGQGSAVFHSSSQPKPGEAGPLPERKLVGAVTALDTEAFTQHNRPGLARMGRGRGQARGTQAQCTPERLASVLECPETSRWLCAATVAFPKRHRLTGD